MSFNVVVVVVTRLITMRMMMKMVMIAVLKSKPPRTSVTAKTEPNEMARDRTVSSTIVKYC